MRRAIATVSWATDEPAFRRYRSLPQRRRTQQRDVGGRAHEPVKSVISKRVSDLERRLGVRLLYRTTRNVEPTEAGISSTKAAKASLQELNNAAEIVALRENDLCGELRIVTPMSFGTLWLSPIIADFMSQHPRLEIVLQMDDRLTDFEGRLRPEHPRHPPGRRFADRPAAGQQPAGGLLQPRLRGTPRHAGRPRTTDAARCLGYNNATPSQVWTFEPAFPGAKPVPSRHADASAATTARPMRDAALRGQGLALLPLFIVAGDLKERPPGGRRARPAPTRRRDLRDVFAGGGDVAEGQGVHPASPAGAVGPALGQRLSDRTIPRGSGQILGMRRDSEPVVSPRPATRPTRENCHDRAYPAHRHRPARRHRKPPKAPTLCGANLQKLDDILAVRGKTSVTGARVTGSRNSRPRPGRTRPAATPRVASPPPPRPCRSCRTPARNDPRQTQGG